MPDTITNQIIEITEGKEVVPMEDGTPVMQEVVALPIYHFLKLTKGNIIERFIVTAFDSPDEAAAYHASAANRGAPVNKVMALNTGDYIFSLLKLQAADKGVKFRFRILKNRDLNKLKDPKNPNKDLVLERLNASNYSWANADNSFFVRFQGAKGFNLDVLGLEAEYTAKLSKRLQEVTRATRSYIHSATGREFIFVKYEDVPMVKAMASMHNRWIIAEFENPEGDVDEDWDGINGISYELWKAMKLRGKRANIRLLFKRGLVKGDAVRRPRAALNGADFVYPTVNLKTELRTTGWVLITGFEHEALHSATIDLQSKTNNPVIYSKRTEYRDVMRLKEEAAEFVAHNKVPKWMKYREVKRNDGSVPSPETAQPSFISAFEEWTAVRGLEPQAAQNYWTMALTSFTVPMEAGMNPKTGWYSRMYVPMGNAFMGGVITHKALTKMLGYKSDFSGDKVYWVDDIGLVIPDARFKNTFDLHGTWDQDDSVKVILIKVWSSSPEYTQLLREDHIIGEDVEIPEKEEDAIYMVALIRSPNGPGEYSLELFDGLLPFFNYDPEDVDVVDLWSLPRGQKHMLELAETSELPSDESIVFGGPMTMRRAHYMIKAQKNNKGIGRLANFLMVWTDTMGVSFPPVVEVTINDAVDATQQEHDPVKIAAVAAAAEHGYQQLAQLMAENPSIKMDASIFAERVPEAFRELFDPKQIVERRQSKGQKLYHSVYTDIRTFLAPVALKARSESELVKRIQTEFKTTQKQAMWAEAFFKNGRKLFSQVDRDHEKDLQGNPNTLVKVSSQHNKAEDIADVMRYLASVLLQHEDWQDKVLCLYKWVTKSNFHPDWEYGLYDRVIFQASTRVEVSVADLLIEALEAKGFI